MSGWHPFSAAVLAAALLVISAPATAQGPTCFGESATIIAVAGVPTRGTANPDVIVGTPGADDIRGRGGDDLICGGGGADVIRGNRGADRINGGRGPDMVSGGGGNDVIVGAGGNDVLLGNGGKDTIRGKKGADDIRGGRGNDHLRGNGGHDSLNGGRGIDVCLGGSGINTIESCNEMPVSPTPTPAPTPTPTPGNGGGATAVRIDNFAFSPPSVTVSAGTTITWTNDQGVAHTVTDNANAWTSGPFTQGGTFSRQFNGAGTFAYYCTIHPSMTASVTVSP